MLLQIKALREETEDKINQLFFRYFPLVLAFQVDWQLSYCQPVQVEPVMLQ